MPTNIHQFQSEFKGGVRPNLFSCNIGGPDIGFPGFEFHCKGTSLPASTIGNIPVPYHGRQLMVPGDRTFGDWTVTVFNDVDMIIRHNFESWMKLIQNHRDNTSHLGGGYPYGQATVTQLRRTGEALRSYTIGEIYPTECAAIDLAWDSNDAVEEYAVTFAVNNWFADGMSPGSSSGGDNSKWKAGVSITTGSGGTSAKVHGSYKDKGLNLGGSVKFT